MADAPLCRTCNTAHWPFQKDKCVAAPAEAPEDAISAPAPAAVSAWPEAPPAGLRAPRGFGEPENSLDESLSDLGFGQAPATIGYERPRRRS
jgi:hypothetical protein